MICVTYHGVLSFVNAQQVNLTGFCVQRRDNSYSYTFLEIQDTSTHVAIAIIVKHACTVPIQDQRLVD